MPNKKILSKEELKEVAGGRGLPDFPDIDEPADEPQIVVCEICGCEFDGTKAEHEGVIVEQSETGCTVRMYFKCPVCQVLVPIHRK